MDIKERDIRIARLVESEHGKFLITLIEDSLGSILHDLDEESMPYDQRIIGAYLGMKKFLVLIENAPSRVRGDMNMVKLEKEELTL
jgi:hypothetical protein